MICIKIKIQLPTIAFVAPAINICVSNVVKYFVVLCWRDLVFEAPANHARISTTSSMYYPTRVTKYATNNFTTKCHYKLSLIVTINQSEIGCIPYVFTYFPHGILCKCTRKAVYLAFYESCDFVVTFCAACRVG